MANLGSPQNTAAVLQKYGLHCQKRYGQNFLVDAHILEKIIAAAQITKDDFVLEIGPGIGTLTQYLCENARKVLAVEIDRNLIPALEDTLQDYPNITIWNEDILKIDLNKLVADENDGRPIKIVANLPYYITSPVIMGILESHVPAECITVMVQKEAADRMQALPGTKDYGALSLAVQYYTSPKVVTDVSPNCFLPRPKVSSSIIRLVCRKSAPVDVKDEKLLFGLIRASFNQRRKTLINGLANSPELSFEKEQIREALAGMGLPPAVRGETLSLEQFASLCILLAPGEGKAEG